MVGTIVRGRLTTGSTDSQELVDGELAARVFGLLRICDLPGHPVRYSEQSRQRLDVALLHFFQHFRKVYVGEQARGVQALAALDSSFASRAHSRSSARRSCTAARCTRG